MLPNFIIIGAPRTGTTFIYKMLIQHPDIYLARNGYIGDIHFFNPGTDVSISAKKNWEKGFEWYEKFFDKHNNEKAIGEKTAHYLSDPLAPELIKKYIPDIKLIAILRNPIDRAYSDYWYHRGEIPRNASIIEAGKMQSIKRIKIIEAGMYYNHLQNYLEYFNRDQLLIIIHDYMMQNPLKELKKIFRFLEVDDNFIPKDYDKKINRAIAKGGLSHKAKIAGGYVKQNLTFLYKIINRKPFSMMFFKWIGKSSESEKKAKGYQKMTEQEWSYLSDIYYKEDEKLSGLLGIDLISLWHKKQNYFSS